MIIVERWPGGFRATDRRGPDRGWLEAICQTLWSEPVIRPLATVAIFLNTALLLAIMYILLRKL